MGLRLLILFPPLLFVVFILFQVVVLNPIAERAEFALGAEYNQITPLPQAQLWDYYSSHKTNSASASGKYSTALNYEAIRSYYDTELTKHGWQFVDERNITLGAIGRIYSKGDYMASLDYYGIGYPWKYNLYVAWGSSSNCYLAETCHLFSIIDSIFAIGFLMPLMLFTAIVGWASWRMQQKEFAAFATETAIVSKNVWGVRITSILFLIFYLLCTTLLIAR